MNFVLRVMDSIQRQLSQLDKNLRASFSKLKLDLTKQSAELEQLKSRLADQEALIRKLLEQLAALSQKSTDNTVQVFGNRSVRSIQRSESVRRSPNNLTQLHLSILKRLMALQIESSKRAISMRELAAEVYPTREYSNIKSTLSEHIKKLHQAGLVEKIHRGRLYLSYTEEALQYTDSQRVTRMKKLISMPL